MCARRGLLIALCLAAAMATASAAEAGRYHPRLRFHALRAPHFTIYYHQGEAQLAQRLADVAEDVREDLSRQTGLDAPAHVHVVLVDQSDVANGWSTPVPYDLIEIAAAPPAPSSFLGHEDDWLRLVFAHEFAHVLHLDRTGGLMKGLRHLLGRHPATFPNLFVPGWQVEGFATWAESAVTGSGRNYAADVRSAIRATAASRAMSIDRAGGGLDAWPSGHAAYFFGGRFYERLADQKSAAAIGDWARRSARRLPYFGSGAFRGVFGESPQRAWKAAFSAPPLDGAPVAREPRRLTWDGFVVSGPRVIRTSRAAGLPIDAVYYSTQGPHRFPEIRRVALGGTASAPVTSRYTGNVLSSDGRWLFFDQLEYDGAVALVSDLYAFDVDGGHTLRLSHGQRLTDPDVSPGGSQLVAVRAVAEERRMVLWPVSRDSGGRPVLANGLERPIGISGCVYATPRWSPDGARIVAVRQCAGSLPAIVLLDADGNGERLVTPDGRTRNITPAWSPDGHAILFASDREDHRFKIYGIDAAADGPPANGPVVLVDAPGGAIWPDVAPDGGTVVFTSLTADGYDVFAAPLPVRADRGSSPAGSPGPPSPSVAGQDPERARPAHSGRPSPPPADAGAYSPWRTLVPRAWLPIAFVDGERLDVGGTVGASDALGYHAYQFSASWRAASEAVDVGFGGPAVQWSAWYSYNRWRPAFVLSASDTIDTVTVGTGVPGVVRTSDERTRELFAGVVVPWRRVRVIQNWFAGVDAETRRLPQAAGVADRRRNGLRLGWNLSNAHTFGYSISPERGVRLGMTLERVLPELGADGQATSFTADGRAYLPALGRHDVVAIHAAVGASTGDAASRRRFSLGEAVIPESALSFGRHSLGLLRGPGPDAFGGSSLLVANLDYRFPLWRVERGVRTWPFFVRDVHGALFYDIGATGPSLSTLARPASSLGAELAARLTLGYSWNLNVAAGVGWVHDPARTGSPDRAAAFVRTGYAF
jgi:Tol biopolymer transport system component